MSIETSNTYINMSQSFNTTFDPNWTMNGEWYEYTDMHTGGMTWELNEQNQAEDYLFLHQPVNNMAETMGIVEEVQNYEPLYEFQFPENEAVAWDIDQIPGFEPLFEGAFIDVGYNITESTEQVQASEPILPDRFVDATFEPEVLDPQDQPPELIWDNSGDDELFQNDSPSALNEPDTPMFDSPEVLALLDPVQTGKSTKSKKPKVKLVRGELDARLKAALERRRSKNKTKVADA